LVSTVIKRALRRSIIQALPRGLKADFFGGAVGAVAPVIVQETNPVYWQNYGPTPADYTLPQATAAGNTLVMHIGVGYGHTLTIQDSEGGTVANGAWTREIIEEMFTGVAGNGDPLNDLGGRQHVFVRRNAPAGITSVSVTNSSAVQVRTYFREVSGLSNEAPIVRVNARAVAGQNATAIAVPGAGFMSALIRTSPSRTPVSASPGSVIRRADFLSDNVSPYTSAVSEHTVHGISSGARSFDSSWADGASTIGYHGIFIPAA
jgi:hypothetical protein